MTPSPSTDRSTSPAQDADCEKRSVLHEEYVRNMVLTEAEASFLESFSDQRRKEVLRKVDWRLVPMLLILYLLSFIDRANIGNAKIEGLTKDLFLSDMQYNIALSVFFIPYTLCEIPSNTILNKFKRPSLFMAIIVFVWGLAVMCTGFAKNFAGLVVLRIILGIFEAGFFPGAILIVSKWYLPYESQTRIAIFFTASALAGAFSGLLAYAISMMDGIGGYEGWRWIFILEGLASSIIGIACYWLLIDSPELSTRWLDSDEIRYLKLRQVARRNTRPDEYRDKGFDKGVFLSVLKDWKIYCLIFAFWSNVVPNYGLKFTMPTIMVNMGYDSAAAQLLTIPAYTVGAVSAYVFAVFSDKCKWRMPFIVGPQVAVVIAEAILFSKSSDIQNNIALCYFAVCLACFGLYPIGSGVQAWNLSNLPHPTKRALGIGYMTCIGNMGGIAGSYIFIDSQAPTYPVGFGSSLAFASAGIIACSILEFGLWTLNLQKRELSEEDVRSKYTDAELDRMGESSPLFKYTL